MNAMIRFVFLMLLSFTVSATDIQLTWTQPELREDGSQIENIDRFNLYTTVNNGSQNVYEVAATLSSYTVYNVEKGTHTFQISTVEAGRESELSGPISVNVSPSKPVKIMLTVELIN